ncbi:MAG: class I SAM-dependent methyltransferase [Acidobacteriia bacterium]|nr:class I SAM-dependent methyltransferase [Terriglobia bacterium]
MPETKTRSRLSVRRALESDNPISRTVLMAYRAKVALGYCTPKLAAIPSWLLHSREFTNFTYDLTERNLSYLASTLSLVTGQPVEDIAGFLREPAHDRQLQAHVRSTVNASRLRSVSDSSPRFGRRLGWYALARALKPSVLVETGVDKGLGSVLLCSALLRNAEEGHPGLYYGTDINPKAGYLLHGAYARVGKVLCGDSIASLKALDHKIDLFVNDSDHSAEYELAEYRTIAVKLSERAVILGDNSHCSDSLWTFSRESNREFIFFAEEPAAHWYPGGGIGISLRRKQAATQGLTLAAAAAGAVAGRSLFRH